MLKLSQELCEQLLGILCRWIKKFVDPESKSVGQATYRNMLGACR